MSTRKARNFPSCNLVKALSVAQKIQDENAGRPFKRLLLAEALGIKPASTNFRDLLSASNKYGLTEGNEKSIDITLTPIGRQATYPRDKQRQREALQKAALTPAVFKAFYKNFENGKLPSDMLPKLLASDYGVSVEYTGECASIIVDNGRLAGIIRDISGSPYVMLDAGVNSEEETNREPLDTSPLASDMVELDVLADGLGAGILAKGNGHADSPFVGPRESGGIHHETTNNTGPRPIFISHGKKRGPLVKLEKLLTTFKIPYKVVVDEPNLARPIPKKVRDTMFECNSAILIFTRDEKFHDESGNEIWRPSENVVHELGAASFAYEDRVVIFKEKGLTFPTNFNSVGYIEFEEDSIEARAMELLKELIAMNLVKLMPV